MEGAKKYMEEALKKRPDLIMEASDINGEFKLCLQIISTALLEKQSGEKGFLNNLDNYEEIICHFKKLNQLIMDSHKRELSLEESNWLKNTNSQTAIAVARQIYK